MENSPGSEREFEGFEGLEFLAMSAASCAKWIDGLQFSLLKNSHMYLSDGSLGGAGDDGEDPHDLLLRRIEIRELMSLEEGSRTRERIWGSGGSVAGEGSRSRERIWGTAATSLAGGGLMSSEEG
ncbi:uncharacterized protein A4U43_C07F31310 [Asparagus officinalis]|uniref:PH domain-containing protein n=1 Tax=Asparagus officinalis TaxID=4686 RepID=A0A5P1EGL4_ASPOF|nr:uncharacterized protein A4U43_C07F31310 [Asparagus officinalis]